MLLKEVFEGNQKNAVDYLQKIFNEGLDAKNFLNDVLYILNLFSRKLTLGSLDKDLSMSVHPLVRDGQYVREGSILAQIDTTINRSGVIGAVYSTKDNYKEMLFLGNRDFKKQQRISYFSRC